MEKDESSSKSPTKPPGESPTKDTSSTTEGGTQLPALLRLNTYKAGLDGLDTDRANKLIKMAGSRKGSRFYEHQEKRQKKIDEQIEELKKKAAKLDPGRLQKAMHKADGMIRELESQRVVNRVIVHFDMDMFFAACEIKADPSLADKPMAVGSMAMISTSNYVARKFGVRSAMAGFIAKRLCPQLVLIHPHMSLYKKESDVIMAIIQEYDPNPSTSSLDEVYIDLTDYLFQAYSREKGVPVDDLYRMVELPDDIWDMAADIVKGIRARVHEESQLTVSAGISCNTLVSKVCTDMNKPNGQFMVKGRKTELMDFVAGLKLRKFPGVGPVRVQMYAGLGMELGKDIYDKRDLVVGLFSDLSSYDAFRVYLGIGSTSLSSGEDYVQKSHSREHTMSNTNKLPELTELLQGLAEQLSRDLKKHGQVGRTITLKLKKNNFQVFLKGRSIPNYTDDDSVLFRVAKEFLIAEHNTNPNQEYRLIGIKASSLKDKTAGGTDGQTTLEKMFGKRIKKGDDSRPAGEQGEASTSRKEKKGLAFPCRLCDDEFASLAELEIHKANCNGDFFHVDDEDGDSDEDPMQHMEEYYDPPSPDFSFADSSREASSSSIAVHLNPAEVMQVTFEGSTPTSASNTTQRATASTSSSTFNNTSVSPRKPPGSPRGKIKIFDRYAESMLCPICNMNLVFEDNHSLNAHIDTCLNRSLCTDLTRVSPIRKDRPNTPDESLHNQTSSSSLTINSSKKGQKRKKGKKKTASPTKGIDSYFGRLPS